MLIACWSAKGGSGTTVVATALAVTLARGRGGGRSVVLCDLGGDAPAVLGREPVVGELGVSDWLAAGSDDAALDRLLVPASSDVPVRLLPAGSAGTVSGGSAAAGERLAAALAGVRREPRVTVVDCGVVSPASSEPVRLAVAQQATVSLLVLRPCYLALRRAVAVPVRPSGVVLVDDGRRSLGPADVESVLGVPVRAVVPDDPAVARAVDAGVLAERVPRLLERSLRRAAA